LDELGASRDQDVSVELLLQLADLFGEVAVDHRRVVPLGVLQRRRDDELRNRVHLLPELAGAVHRRPRLRESFVGLATEELRLARHQLVELELVALFAAVEPERPAPALGKLIARAINHLGLPAVHDASLTTRPGAEQFDRRFEQHRPELTAYSYRMLGSPFEAEDAVQETFIRAWRAADRFEGRSTLRS